MRRVSRESPAPKALPWGITEMWRSIGISKGTELIRTVVRVAPSITFNSHVRFFGKNLVFLILRVFRVMLQNRIPNLIKCGCDRHYERFHIGLITNFYWGKDAILDNPTNIQLFCSHNALSIDLYIEQY